jgi:hypothetical protein
VGQALRRAAVFFTDARRGRDLGAMVVVVVVTSMPILFRMTSAFQKMK